LGSPTFLTRAWRTLKGQLMRRAFAVAIVPVLFACVPRAPEKHGFSRPATYVGQVVMGWAPSPAASCA
jgi:hypothetical protein